MPAIIVDVVGQGKENTTVEDMTLGPRVRVRAVKPLTGFKAIVTFDNNTQREIDLEPYLHGPVFESIRNEPAVFRAMKIAGGAIAWDNGADIDPERLILRPETGLDGTGGDGKSLMYLCEKIVVWRLAGPEPKEEKK